MNSARQDDLYQAAPDQEAPVEAAPTPAASGREGGRRTRLVTILCLLAGIGFGAAFGTGFYTFVYAKGFSYLRDDPAACVNCHIMREQFEGWERGSHHAVATCNDCHTPHTLIAKYATKALNGYHHSYAFTTGDFHEPIRVSPRNRAITEAACRHCHSPIVEQIDTHAPGGGDTGLSCIRCHVSVGHLH